MMRLRNYILKGRTPVPVDNFLEWAMWWETAQRHGDTRVGLWKHGGRTISTVFLGLDHGSGDGPPLLFETMIFRGSEADERMERYSTWDEAEAGHMALCKILQREIALDGGATQPKDG